MADVTYRWGNSIFGIDQYEGDSGVVTFDYILNRSGATNLASSIDYTVSGAVDAADFVTPLTGTLSFAPGELSKHLVLQAVGDRIVEQDESFQITLSNDPNAALPAPMPGKILNDDGGAAGPVSLGLSGTVQHPEGDSGATPFVFTVTRSGDLSGSSSVDWFVWTADGAPAQDIAGALAGTVYFAPGEAARTIQVTVAGDTAIEPDETFNVTLANARGATIGTGTAQGIIQDDDGQPGGPGTGGQTYTSDNSGQHWSGSAGNDTFNLGRGGDVVTGNGGDDTFKFAEVPWAAGRITDFTAGDVLDLAGLAATTGDRSGDGFAAGYLRIGDDGHGSAQVWASYSADGSNPWLVVTLNGVGAATLTHTGDVVTVAPAGQGGSAVRVSASSYAAAPDVTTIYMEGTGAQSITGNNAGDTIWSSNNSGNSITGGGGDDVFHLGRAGDRVTGGGGADVFAYDETPWAAGRITDFSSAQGDVVDLRGLLARSGYTGADPVADGYLKLLDTTGGTQIWADPDGPGSALGWWLVTTFAESAANLKLAGGEVTGGGTGAVTVEASSYTTRYTGPLTITLAGSGHQTVGADTAVDVFIDNDQPGNVLRGGTGDNTYILGGGGTTVLTGTGTDTIVIDNVPAHEAVAYYFTPGVDRLDLHGLLEALGSTGPDPFHDGHLELITDINGATHMLAYDPDARLWNPVIVLQQVSASQLHYADGWLS